MSLVDLTKMVLWGQVQYTKAGERVLAATRPDGSATQVEVRTSAGGAPVWRVLP